MELVKNILFNITLICGSICSISLLVAGAIRCICIMIDHLQVADTFRKALVLYVKTKNPNLQHIKESDVDLSKRRIKIK